MRASKSIFRKLREITLREFAVLEMTNDPKAKDDSGIVILTEKEAYIWAVLLAHIAEKHPEITPEQIIRAATLGPNIRGSIKSFYKEFPSGQGETKTQVIRPDPVNSAIGSLNLDVSQSNLDRDAKLAYKNLVRRGWIEDPLELAAGGLLFAVLGVIPVSFTQKTKEGRRISKKLKALYWTYERSESRGIATTKVEFRLIKMIKAFKEGIIGGFKNAMKEYDDEGA